MTSLALIGELRKRNIRIAVAGGKLQVSGPKGAVTQELRQLLAQQKNDLIALLGSSTFSAPEIVPAPPDARLPLSFGQQRLWFLDRMDPDNTAYTLPLILRLGGELNFSALQTAIEGVVHRHAALRTCFPDIDGQPFQLIAPPAPVPLPVEDLSPLPTAERERAAMAAISHELGKPFDISQGPLFRTVLYRLGAAEHLLYLAMHHAVSDAWSLTLLFREMTELYNAGVRGVSAELPDLPVQYGDYAYHQRAMLTGERLEALLGYWREKLSGSLPILELPSDYRRGSERQSEGGTERLRLAPALCAAANDFSQAESATLFMTMAAAYATVLHRQTALNDIVIGWPAANRNRIETENLIGMFVDSLVLRVSTAGNPTFRELVRRVREAVLEALDHQDLPFERIVDMLHPTRSTGHTSIFQVFLNMLPGAFGGQRMEGLTVENVDPENATAKFELTLYISQTADTYELVANYTRALFAGARMHDLLEQISATLEHGTRCPECRVDDISLVTEKSRTVLPNPTAPLPLQADVPVTEQFAAHALRSPDAPALLDDAGQCTYGELDAGTGRLVAWLQTAGIGRNDTVAVYGSRSAELVWALLGIWKAGAAFVVLDPLYPEARTEVYASLAAPSAWIFIGDGAKNPAKCSKMAGGRPLIRVAAGGAGRIRELLPEVEAVPAVASEPGDLAYIAITSGSTGRPKAIRGIHLPLWHFAAWYTRTFKIGRDDRFSMISGLSHDPLLRDIFVPLSAGACIAIPDASVFDVAGRLHFWLARMRVSIMHLTPAMGRFLCAAKTEVATQPLEDLRWAFFGGEVLTLDVIDVFKNIARKCHCVNFYGATETPQAMAWYQVPHGADSKVAAPLKQHIPVGAGIDGAQLLLVNSAGNLCAPGEPGEIYIRTPYLADGYLTEEPNSGFLTNPFTGDFDDRVYRTGDRGRYDIRGDVEFIGRADEQIKIRGFRIEPAEVAAAIRRHPAIRDTVVIARGTDDDLRLAACLVPAEAARPDPAELRSFLRQYLPEYMIPSLYSTLPRIPLTPNGKVDINALNAIPFEEQAARSYVAERTALEHQLVDIWEKVLGVSPVGIHDNYFEIGGHSITAVRIFSEIAKLTGRQLPLATLFHGPTIAELHDFLTRDGWTPPWPSLVPIQPRGSKPPFFCVHGAGGNVLGYEALARYLGPDQPFYGLQSTHLQGRTSPVSIEEMAGHYVDEIQSLHPTGPYLLGGASFGGTVAFEMARQLEQRGFSVALLALFDARRPGVYQDMDARARLHFHMRRARFHMKYLVELPVSGKIDYISRKLHTIRRRLKTELLGLISRSFTTLEKPLPGLLRTVYELNANAIGRYRPLPYRGRITLFRASAPSLEFTDASDSGWSGYAGEIEIHSIGGDHVSLLKEPHVVQLAEVLTGLIAQATADSECRQAPAAYVHTNIG